MLPRSFCFTLVCVRSQFASQIAGEVLLHHEADFRITFKVALQRLNFPANGSDWFCHHCIHFSLGAAQNEWSAFFFTS